MERHFERYTKRILEILRFCDINTLSALQVRLQIQSEYKVDLTPVKKRFEKHVSTLFQQIYANIMNPVDEISTETLPIESNRSAHGFTENIRYNSNDTRNHNSNILEKQLYVTTGSLQPANNQYHSADSKSISNDLQNIPNSQTKTYISNTIDRRYEYIAKRINQVIHDADSSNDINSTKKSFPKPIEQAPNNTTFRDEPSWDAKNANYNIDSVLKKDLQLRTESNSNNQKYSHENSKINMPTKKIIKNKNLYNHSASPSKQIPPHPINSSKSDQQNSVGAKEIDRSPVLIEVQNGKNVTPILTDKSSSARVGPSLSKGLKHEMKSNVIEVIDLDSLEKSMVRSLDTDRNIHKKPKDSPEDRSMTQSVVRASNAKADFTPKKKKLKRTMETTEEDELEESDSEVTEGYIFPKGTPLKSKQSNPKLCNISPELQVLVGHTILPYKEIIPKVWEYIKKHNLQDPKDKRVIIGDANFIAMSHLKRMSMNDLQKVIAPHYSERLVSFPSTPVKRKAKSPEPQLPSDVLSAKRTVTMLKKEKIFQISTYLKEIIQRTSCTLKVVHSKLFEYIRTNRLQKDDRIVVDHRLRNLFVGMNEINVFDITNPKYLDSHMEEVSLVYDSDGSVSLTDSDSD